MAQSNIPAMANLSLGDKFNFPFAQKKPGSGGTKLKVKANFAPIKIGGNTIIYQYNIDIKVPDRINNRGKDEKDEKVGNVPQKNRIKQQKRMIDNSNFLIFDHLYAEESKKKDSIFSSEPIFDGRKIIYSKTKINVEDPVELEIRVKIPEKKFLQTFTITISKPPQYVIDLSILNNINNLRSAEKELQALDIIITYGAKKTNIFFNSYMFKRKNDLINLNRDEQQKIRFDLGNMKEASYGSYQAVKLTETGIQLNVDRVAMVFSKGGKILDVFEDYLTNKRVNRNNQNPPRVRINSGFRFDSRDMRLFNTDLKGLNFVVDHISYKPKYTITKITDKPISQIFFDEGQGENQPKKQNSVKNYFDNKYKGYLENNNLKEFKDLPAVQVGIREPGLKYFPLETVEILHDQYYTKKLDPKQQGEMTKRCGEQPPTDRFLESEQQIKNLIQSSKRCTNDYLSYFGITLDLQFSQVDGRYLEMPRICGFQDKDKDLKNGQWNDSSFAEPAPINDNFKWIVVNFSRIMNQDIKFSPRDNEISDLIKNIVSVSSKNGLNLGNPADIIYNEIYRSKAALEERLEQFERKFNGLGLIIFLIPDDDDIYANLKYLTELRLGKAGIVTQCVSHKKSGKFRETTYANNVVLKINTKLGGVNWQLKKDSKYGHLKKKTMIVGLDVTHPSKHDRLGNSVASAVATFSSNFVNYYTKSTVQPPSKEIIDLKNITVELLDNFYNKQKAGKQFYPEYVLVYRDGVSEGQFNDVIEFEINAMKKAFQFIGEETKTAYNPKLTYIIVQKRHHTRFLAVNPKDREPRKHNVRPGLIVDKGIVSNYYSDFYLVAHAGAMGTSRPTRYLILYDESGFSGDDIQKTTYYLSHLYPKCMKTISVIPPVQYSHLAAKRARQWLFSLDNRRGQVFGEEVLNKQQIEEINRTIEIPDSLINKLFYV